MFQVERLELIKKILSEKKSIDVIGLSGRLKVSEVTIRRDLEKLEGEGFLKRTYGGAILNSDVRTEQDRKKAEEDDFPISERGQSFGRIGASLIEDYDIVFLSGGEANIALIDYIGDKNGVVIFTNSLQVLLKLRKYKKIKVILIGGEFDYQTDLMSVQRSNFEFPDIYVNKAFLYVQGIDLNKGLFVNDQEDAFLYEKIKQRTKNMVLYMESTVYEKIGLIPIDEIDQIDTIITDNGIPDQYKKTLYQMGIQIHQQFDI